MVNYKIVCFSSIQLQKNLLVILYEIHLCLSHMNVKLRRYINYIATVYILVNIEMNIEKHCYRKRP